MSVFINTCRIVSRIRDKAFSLLVAGSFHRFGKRSVMRLPVRLGGESAIDIGSRVHIGSNCWLEVMEAGKHGDDPVIAIGDRVSIAGDCTITGISRVVIGNGVLIARFVHISDHSHAHSSSELPVMEQGVTKIAPVTIRDGAWIGHGVVICPGVTIGRNAVVGANSVVRADVPDFCVAAGVPAKIISVPESSESS